MMVNLRACDWQALRILVRRKNKPTAGRELRHTPTRSTKDGSFLTELADRKLLLVVGLHRDPFQTTYVLTDAGKHAAEYGEYDADPRSLVALDAGKAVPA